MSPSSQCGYVFVRIVNSMFHNSRQKSNSYSFTHLMYLFLIIISLFLFPFPFPFLFHFMSKSLSFPVDCLRFFSSFVLSFPTLFILRIAHKIQRKEAKTTSKSETYTAYGSELSMDCLIYVTLNTTSS